MKKSIFHFIPHIVGIFICVYISFIAFDPPKKAHIAGGDFYQLVDAKNNTARYFYGWIQQDGQGLANKLTVTYPYYSIIAGLEKIGLEPGQVAQTHVFLFLILSFYSFFTSIQILFPKINPVIKIGSSLIYILNNFTVTIFTYPWGINHHFLIYIFFPPLIILYVKILLEKEKPKIFIAWFGVTLLLATPAFNNPAFLLLILFIQFLFTITLLLLKVIKIEKSTLVKIVQIGFLYFLATFWFIIPQIIDNPNIIQETARGQQGLHGNLGSWIKGTSSNFVNSFFLALDSNRFPILSVSSSTILSIIYFGIIIWLLHQSKKIKKTKIPRLAQINLVVLIILILLTIRAYGPLEHIGLFLYQLPLFSAFRSPDKIFLAIPLIYLLTVVSLLDYTKIKAKYTVILFLTLIAIPTPFFNGKIYETLQKGDGQYSYSVEIPKEYYSIQKIINEKTVSGTIISLPHSVINSINWSNYPKWQFIGTDILHLLYRKPYITANSYDHPQYQTKLSFQEFNKKKSNPEELLRLIKKFSGHFIIFHKDIEPTSLKENAHTQNSLQTLANRSEILLRVSNDYFDLYEVPEKNFQPLVSITNASGFFQAINPAKIKVYAHLDDNQNALQFNQSFAPQWKIFLKKNPTFSWCETQEESLAGNWKECAPSRKFFEGEELSFLWKKSLAKDSHEISQDYANLWPISTETIKKNYPESFYRLNSDGSMDVEMVIFFYPQIYIYLGMINILVFLSLVGYLIKNRRK